MVAGLGIGYLGGVPAAIVAIAVPVRVPFPMLHSVSLADAVIVGAVLREMDRGSLRIRPRWGPVAIFTALAFCSIAFSIDRSLTLRGLIVLAEGLLLGLATRNYVARRRANPEAFLRLWLVVGLFAAVSALGFFLFSNPLVWWNLQKPTDSGALLSDSLRLGSPFWGASNYYASMLLLFVPVACLAILVGRNRLLAFAALAAMAPALYLTTSRGAILALAAGTAYFLARFVRSLPRLRSAAVRDRRILGLLLAGTALVALVVTGPELVNYFFLSRDTQVGSLASGDRLLIYQTAIAFIPSHLLVGVGYGAAFSAAPALIGGAHNYLLTLILELGLPGLILGLWAAFAGARVLARHARAYLLQADARAVLVRGGFAGLVLTLINIQVEASFEGVVFFWLFSALMGAAFGSLPSKHTQSE